MITVLLALLLSTSALSEEPSATLPDSPSQLKDRIPQASAVEVFSLDPTPNLAPKERAFQGYRVLGSTIVGAGRSRAALLSALALEMRPHDPKGIRLACSEPTYGIRLNVGPDTLDIVLDYTCGDVATYRGSTLPCSCRPTGSARAHLNRALTSAHIPRFTDPLSRLSLIHISEPTRPY